MKLVVFMFASSFAFANLVVAKSDGSSVSEKPEKGIENSLGDVEDSLKNLLDTVTHHFMPLALRIGFSSKASLSCLFDLSYIYNSVKKLDPWALRMLDASGKLSAGLLEGTPSSLGDYDECFSVMSPNRRPVTGEYCLLEVKPPGPVVKAMKDFQTNKHQNNSTLAYTKSFLGFLRRVRTNPDHVMFRLGICVPSTCSVEGIQSIIDMSTESLDLPIEVKHCKKKGGFELKLHHIIIISFLSTVGAVVVFATVFTAFRNNNKTFPQLANSKSGSEREKEDTIASKVSDLWSKMSLNNSMGRFLECTSEGDALDVVRGMKVLTVIFAIFTHTYALPHPLHMYRYRDSLNFVKFVDELMFASVANSSVGVDSFFFLAGFYFVYNRWRLFKRPGIFRYIAKFIFLTCFRMIALQVLVGGMFFLLPTFGSGPLWEEFVEEPLENCKRHWWMNLLFIQNNLGPYDICLSQTWILATMVQIFFITAVLVYILSRWPLYGVICSVATITIGMFGVAAVTALMGYPATFTVYFYDYRTSLSMWKYLYTQCYTHLGPQCIGMLTAYLLAEYPTKKIDKLLSLLLWILSAMTMVLIVFGLYGYRHGEEMDRGLAVFYATVHRQAWAIAIGWIVFACATGRGGVVSSVISWKVFAPLEKLCYLAYLLHIPLMYYRGGIQREIIYMGHFNQVMNFIAYTITSFVLALVAYLFFQVPYEAIEGLFFRGSHGNVWSEKSVNDSQITLKTTENEVRLTNVEDTSSKVMFNRTETDRF